MMPFAGNRLDIRPARVFSTYSISMSRKCDSPLSSTQRLWIFMAPKLPQAIVTDMAMYWKEITVNWGESDPFGLVYYPRIVAWFNDTEHELFRIIGYPIEQMIKNDRTTFVMGEIHFRFIGPAAYGDRIVTTITLAEIGVHTLHWNCVAKNAVTGAPVSEGRATRVYARINEDGSLSSAAIPAAMKDALQELGNLKHLHTNSGATKLSARRTT